MTNPIHIDPNTLKALSSGWTDPTLQANIAEKVAQRNKKIVVLDDDPTGVQTMHDIYVLTQWDLEWIREAFHSPQPLFYILTNTRGLDATTAEQINREIAHNVYTVAKMENIDFCFISRSDSTLRGYYPLEIDTLSNEIATLTNKPYDGHLIIPAFFEGGRYTYQDVHYLLEGENLVPVDQTEFASDKVFGFAHANLCDWVEEKTEGRYQAEECYTIPLELLRKGPDAVEQLLLEVEGNRPVIVNAIAYADLHVLSLALLQAEAKGKRFIYRSAASFVKAYAGITDHPFLSKSSMINQGGDQVGGLVIVGSHVQKTTHQLQQLLEGTDSLPVEMDVEAILDEKKRPHIIAELAKKVNETIKAGKDVVVFSSRTLIASESKEKNLQISQLVSASLVDIVQSLQTSPKFIIAKGGITSSDVATKGLHIKKAKVIGQAAAGIAVWLTGEEAKFPHIPYIVFPGNVGTESTLRDIVLKLN